MKSFKEDGVQLDNSGYDYSNLTTMALNADGTFFVYAYAYGQRHILSRSSTREQAEKLKADFSPPKPPKPTRVYVNHPFGTKKGYYIVKDGSWSVWKQADSLHKHAGPCTFVPTEDDDTHYMDPRIDKEPKQFGCDWDYYVREGKKNFGDPEKNEQAREQADTERKEVSRKTSRARGKRHDMEAVRQYIADGGTLRQIQEKFKVSRATAYRWVTALVPEDA